MTFFKASIDFMRLDAGPRFIPIVALLLILPGTIYCEEQETTMSMKIGSAAFSNHGGIPARYTCDAGDLSPPLEWSDVPAGAKSLVLIVDDPDAPDPAAPTMIWVHWVLYNIPPGASGLLEGVDPGNLPSGTLQGLNDWQRTTYGGPCPPIGRHRYFHKLYALDIVLPEAAELSKAQLEKSMEGHILDQAQLIGSYARKP